jgi:hypothetical protein
MMLCVDLGIIGAVDMVMMVFQQGCWNAESPIQMIRSSALIPNDADGGLMWGGHGMKVGDGG